MLHSSVWHNVAIPPCSSSNFGLGHHSRLVFVRMKLISHSICAILKVGLCSKNLWSLEFLANPVEFLHKMFSCEL